MKRVVLTSFAKGLGAATLLLGVYFGIVSAISGFAFAEEQFSQFWYYIVSLAAGFGIQIGLYSYLKHLVHAAGSHKLLATTGATSTAAMISCCAHYLANLLPILGIGAVVSLISAYQVELFWVGIAFNLGGVVYLASRIIKVRQHDKALSKVNLVIPILIVLAFGFFLWTLLKPDDSTPTTNPPVSSVAKNAWDAQTNMEGGVEVRVQPLSLAPNEWDFEVGINTHSGSLDEDMLKAVSLSDDLGNVIEPLRWDGPPPGGHHRNGILVFAPIVPRPSSITLIVRNVGEIPERKFQWSSNGNQRSNNANQNTTCSPLNGTGGSVCSAAR